jgi:hypothetical protein
MCFHRLRHCQQCIQEYFNFSFTQSGREPVLRIRTYCFASKDRVFSIASVDTLSYVSNKN